MLIAMVTPLFYPVLGGTEAHVLNLSKALIKLGHEVEVHTTTNTYTERDVLPRLEEIEGIKVVRDPRSWDVKGVDVVHIHNFYRMVSLWNFKTLAFGYFSGTPKVFTPHHSFITERPFLVRLLQRGFISRVDKWIAVSRWEQEEMKRRGFRVDNAVVIGNGVEDLAFELPKQPSIIEGEYLAFIGRISPEKNQIMAIECAKKAKVRLVLAGDVRDQRYFEGIKGFLGDDVKYLGKVDEVTKYSLIDNALALVLTSKIEAESIVVKEALVRGTPVIVTPTTGGALEHVKDGYNGFIVNDCEEFVKAVDEIRARREEFSRHAKEGTERFRWEYVAKEVEEVYREVTG